MITLCFVFTGQPYAGAAAQKMGSAPLRKYAPGTPPQTNGSRNSKSVNISITFFVEMLDLLLNVKLDLQVDIEKKMTRILMIISDKQNRNRIQS